MKLTRFFAALALGGAASMAATVASALDIAPYSGKAFADLQQAGKPVALHFHADWCPTCRAQTQVFDGWKGDAKVPGTLLVVDYDAEKALKKQMGVRMQSTLIVFKGSHETARLAGDTDATHLRDALASAR